jgi:hypothetical protein
MIVIFNDFNTFKRSCVVHSLYKVGQRGFILVKTLTIDVKNPKRENNKYSSNL